jgi:L-fuculose-phosphate aldolase
MPELLAARLIEICRLGWQRGFLAGGAGNVSARLDEDRILITPSGRAKALLAPEDLLEVSLSGEVLAGAGQPSGELPIHLAAYRLRPETGAVLHAHPAAATALSLAGRELDCSGLPEMLHHLGSVPTAPYAAPASEAAATAVEPFLAEHRALLLAHHGSLCLGRDLEEAFVLTEMIEHAAQTLLAAESLGGARPLPLAEQESLRRAGSGDSGELEPLAQRLQKVHLALSSEFKVEKRAQDERGRVHLIADGVLARKVSLLQLEPGTGFRGGHRHRQKTEWFYLAAGRCRAEFVCQKSGERLLMELAEGDRVRIPPGVAHRFEALDPLTFVEIADRVYEAADDVAFDWEAK